MPLLSERPAGEQIFIVLVLPSLFGAICGVLLGISAGVYTVLTLLGILGGIGAGYDHPTPREGALRGVAGGALFGTFILLAHAITGEDAKAKLPEPHIVLPIATTLIAVVLGAIGGAIRARQLRAASAATRP
jgi:ABC-type antimicrobial peptide transport system permease subunit